MIWHYTKKVVAGLVIVLIAGLSLTAVVTKARHGALLSVQTGSMVPALEKGDLVSVKRVPAEELKIGDIITFINPANKKQTITHRIYGLPNATNGHKFVTKGDANPSADAPISASAIIGRESYSVSKLGYAVDLIRKPIGLILIIYIPAAFIIVAEIQHLSAYYKSQQSYVVPWRRNRGKKSKNGVALAAKILPLILVLIVALAVPAHALLTNSATLTSNTISAIRTVTPPPAACPTSGNSTTITISGGGSGSINVSNSNNQNAQTGNATSSNGGNATSGNATNCNSTNINVTVH